MTQPPLKAKAYMFGLNYSHVPEAKLNGCINDVKNMAQFLQAEYRIPSEVITDDVSLYRTSAYGILNKLYEIGMVTYRENLDLVWIHFSGHGSYTIDRSGDERDGKDECIVPSDYRRSGLIKDDSINNLLRRFNPRTRVIMVFDSCHSGTVGDVRFSWKSAALAPVVENRNCLATNQQIITISGCLDEQVSMDAYNVNGDFQFTGAMTSCLLAAMRAKPDIRTDIFKLWEGLNVTLKEKQFAQTSKLCSSYDLARQPAALPPKY